MRYPTWDKLRSAYWYSFRDECVHSSPWYLPRLSDPAIVLPEESPDGKWHLFAHTWAGIMHYTSSSGLNWERRKLVFFRSNSPFIYKEAQEYYMLFETHDRDWGKKSKDVTKKGSRVMISVSKDLYSWSQPKVIMEAKDISESSWRQSHSRISRPQLVLWQGRYRLYFGAGELTIYDSGQKSTAMFMMAESDYIEGPYKLYGEPLIEIEPDSEYRNLATGGIRVIALSDCLAAVECSYFYDKDNNRSRSAMLLLHSDDGIEWSIHSVMQTSPLEGWSSRAITGCAVKLVEDEDTWYCYYSANSSRRILGFELVRESLGLLLGKIVRK